MYAVGRSPLSLRGRYLAGRDGRAGSGAGLSYRAAADLWGIRPELPAPIGGDRARGRREPSPASASTAPACSPRRTSPSSTASRSRALPARSSTSPRSSAHPTSRLRSTEPSALGLFDLNAVVDVLDRAQRQEGRTNPETSPRRLRNEHPEERARARLQGTAEAGNRHHEPLLQCPVQRRDRHPRGRRLLAKADGSPSSSTASSSTARGATARSDAASDADLELAGYRVMRLTWDDVTVNGERTLRRLRLALRLA